jgi:hypothetical protein
MPDNSKVVAYIDGKRRNRIAHCMFKKRTKAIAI